MNRHPTEQIRQWQDAYTEGAIDADAATGADILLERIERAQTFRLCRGSQLRPSTLVRLGLADLITVN